MATILVVDDAAQNRYLLETLFRASGYDVATANHGAEALEKARNSPPDLVITDLLMPTMDGFELCRQWKKDERLRRIPFVVYTATYTDEEDERLVLSLGADRFLLKPQKPEALLEVVREMLARVAADSQAVRTGSLADELELLGRHNAALRRKLEAKIAQLEAEVARRAEVEKALRESEGRFRLLADNSLDVVWAMDLEGRFTYVSPSILRLRGYTPQEVMAQPIEQMLLPEGVKLFREQMHQVLQDLAVRGDSDRSGVFEVEMLRKDGTRVWTEVSATVMRDANGKVIGIQGSSRDVTWRRKAEEERRRLQEQLFRAQKVESIGRLTGGIAHDFNNFLSVILNCAGFAIESLPEDHPARADLLEVTLAAEQAAALVRQLLALGRRQVLRPVPLDLNQLLAGIEKMLRRVLGEDVEFVCRPQPGLGLVRADPGQIEQVILNLVVNARDAMPDGGRLVIETSNIRVDEEFAARHAGMRCGSHVVLSVADTGCGMDEQTRERIFEPFFTTKDKRSGTGLGLATVQGIVEQSGGHVWVYSELGKGTVVKVYLPEDTTATAESVAAARPPTVPPLATPKGETILVVEKDAAVREVAARALRSAGYTVLVASSAEEALREAERHAGPIHLLLTDVVMPRVGGQQLAERLHAVRPETQVVYCSGYADEAVVRRGVLETGVNFLAKPFTRADLLRKVREVLDAWQGESVPAFGPPRKDTAEELNLETLEAALRTLPGELRDRLREAVVAARHRRIRELLRDVEARAPEVAAELRRMADGFDYDTLRRVLEK